MVRNETRLMESAIALAEELHFSRAARKVGISQPMLTKNIQDLELILGGPLFVRDRRHVTLSDAGRAYVQHARLSLLYGERAVQTARSVMQEVDIPLYVGRSPYVDPFLVTTLLNVQLPLYPKLKIELTSQYSVELTHDLLSGALDLAIANEPPESAQLTRVQVSESPFYIAMSRRHVLARNASVAMEMFSGLQWVLFERRLHPPLYDSIFRSAEMKAAVPRRLIHVTAPEEAFPFVAEGTAIAFVLKPGALLLARNGVTIRPLSDTQIQLRTFLVSRSDNDSRVASELVRAFMKKVSAVKTHTQMRLPIPGSI